MSNFLCNPSLPIRCPDCQGSGIKAASGSYRLICNRCEGKGLVVKITLTYIDDTVGQPIDETYYAETFERPYRKDDC